MNHFNGEKVVMTSCGQYHSMALTESGRVSSCGHNKNGQLGHDSKYNSRNPLKVIIINNNFLKKIFKINIPIKQTQFIVIT